MRSTKSEDMSGVNSNEVLYIGADVHERETQLAIFEPGGILLQEKRIPTKDLQSYVHSLPAKEKHLALESLGFIYPLYDKLKQVPGCDVAVANPKRIRHHKRMTYGMRNS